jgi:hypothetical protein
MAKPRLLLVEFVEDSPRRDRNAAFFPFYQGFVRRHRGAARWLCLGARRRPDAGGPEPDSDGLRRLQWESSAFAPTHVLFNEAVAPGLLRRLAAAAPACSFLTTADRSGGSGLGSAFDLVGGRGAVRRYMPYFYRTGWLGRWLGLDCGAPAYFVEAAQPCYEARMLNEAARRARPFLTIVGGIPCDYHADVGRNPRFRGVDLGPCVRRTGCAFCSHSYSHAAMGPLDLDPVRLARAQFAALLRDAGGRGRNCGRFDVYDVRLFRRLGDFFGMLFALDFPPAQFCFAPRFDQFLRARADLERLLPKLAARGHRLSLFRMGIEHFSESENARFNKGLTARQIDQGLDLARRLSAAFPESFDCDQPFGYIAFTPWTTLKDAAVSVSQALRRGFSPQGPWLYSALRLEPGTPITELARQQGGIVRRRFADPALLYACALEGPLLPGTLAWRFKDRRTETAFGIIARVCALSLRGIMPDAAFAGDPFYDWIARSARQRGMDLRRPDLFAARLLEIMRSARAPRSRKALVLKVWDSLGRRPQGAAA